MRKSRWVEGDEFDLYKFKLLSFRFYLGWIRRSIFRANLFTKDHDWSQLKVPRIAHRIKPLVTFAKKKPMELNTNFHVFSKIFFFYVYNSQLTYWKEPWLANLKIDRRFFFSFMDSGWMKILSKLLIGKYFKTFRANLSLCNLYSS